LLKLHGLRLLKNEHPARENIEASGVSFLPKQTVGHDLADI